MTPRLIALFLLCLVGSWLSSCSSAPYSLYRLSAEGAPPRAGGVGIGLGPVTTADYLSRPNLIMQEGSHKMTPAESHRWAGTLENNIATVMAANLGHELRTSQVVTYPWTGDEGLSYQVALDIHALHGHSDGHAVLEAAWRVYALPGKTKIASRTWTATEPLLADGYEELVAAESRLLAGLAHQIAGSLR